MKVGAPARFVVLVSMMSVAAATAARAQSRALRSAEALRSESGLAWSSATTPGFAFHLQKGSPAEAAAEILRQQAAEARTDVLALLDQPVAPGLELFYVASRDEMEALTGARPKALSVPEAGFALFVFNDRVAAHHRHELTHVLAGHFWGSAARPARWVNEGLAQHAEGACGGMDLDVLASVLRERGPWVAPLDLVWAFGTHPQLPAQVLAASLVGYLVSEYGLDRFEALWRHGIERFDALYGSPFEEVSRAWERSLADQPAPDPNTDWSALTSSGCG